MDKLTQKEQFDAEMEAIRKHSEPEHTEEDLSQDEINETIAEVQGEIGHSVTSEEYLAEKAQKDASEGAKTSLETFGVTRTLPDDQGKRLRAFLDDSGRSGGGSFDPVALVLLTERGRLAKEHQNLKDSLASAQAEMMKKLASDADKMMKIEGGIAAIDRLLLERVDKSSEKGLN